MCCPRSFFVCFRYNHKQDRAYTFPELQEFASVAGLHVVDVSYNENRYHF
jgi:hypothetical protein